MGNDLAGTFPADAPGLPRGRGRLDREQVREAQRPRLLRAAISAIAEVGYSATTVADIVTRARVARAAFYEQFPTKEACFLAAVGAGRDSVLRQVVTAADGAASHDWSAVVRAAMREYLRVAASEPEFTRAWTLELPGAGPAAVRLRNEYLDTLAATMRSWHRMSGSPPATDNTYLALVGGCLELFYRYVADGRTAELPELEDAFVSFLTTGLQRFEVPTAE
ncbi:TetR/AcrR family transcriptional regulator [Antrihabitans cavernicola]|uniref:TetR/AcrR family transcriptional regulator n=1 Tax=Antrihabitans cavernicola TaxID=2495913 RepID=A0A5A7SBE3_9NOCA|nr:TetR/AcrR family transcriptional regulator [Spelaeibacter cavernicola]KAA0022619.1 TetR/AcrR family transcriptional regulator [Spelaeibacter cavernicola]